MDTSSTNPSIVDVPMVDQTPPSTQGELSFVPVATPGEERVGQDTGLGDANISDPNLEIGKTMDDTSMVKNNEDEMMMIFLSQVEKRVVSSKKKKQPSKRSEGKEKTTASVDVDINSDEKNNPNEPNPSTEGPTPRRKWVGSSNVSGSSSSKVLKGRVIDPSVASELGIERLIEKLKFQGWKHLFLCPLPKFYEYEVVAFYTNLDVKKDRRYPIMVMLSMIWKGCDLLQSVPGLKRKGPMT
ncbi:hypothetical protein HAX54_052560 [Datura stramonium]|uniref:Uncharacterized protein n=1 Tax=Datura stramonium TaxID=4076 RepID=A0ABS8T057_DATST|nr:hypothetical protein [Datura stramonium]